MSEASCVSSSAPSGEPPSKKRSVPSRLSETSMPERARPSYAASDPDGSEADSEDGVYTWDGHSFEWGATLEEAFEGAGLAVLNYMTPLSGIAVDPGEHRTVEVRGDHQQELLHNFLDEVLFLFCTDAFVATRLAITRLDREQHSIHATAEGGFFDRHQHECGTEVKAITYSAMQINEGEGHAEVFVIVDI